MPAPAANFPPSVVVTGMGAFCAGGSTAQLWQNACDGRVLSAPRLLERSHAEVPVYAAPAPVFSSTDQPLLRGADRAAALALAAAREAWNQAAPPPVAPLRIGVLVGSSRGPVGVNESGTLSPVKRPSASVHTTFASIAGIVSTALQAEACALMVSSTCTSSATALHTALQMLRAGSLDVAVVGGVDAPLVDSLLEQFIAAGVLASGTGSDALRPFDHYRSGTVLGEGAAFLVLETGAAARARGARIHGEISAVTLQCQSFQRTSMDGEGELLQQVIRRSLAEARLTPDAIDLLHLHGTGTRMNDAVEARAIHAVFGKPKLQPEAWASKAITGHVLGASSLLQVILTLHALRHGLVPHTVNYSVPDPGIPLRLNTGCPLAQPLRHGLCTTSGFWGNASSIILQRPAENPSS